MVFDQISPEGSVDLLVGDIMERRGEGYVTFNATPNPFLLNKI